MYKGYDDPIAFSKSDCDGPYTPHNDILVVTAKIANYDVSRILVDDGASINILEYKAFNAIKLHNHNITPT